MIIDGHIHIGKWSEVFLNYKTTVRDAINVMRQAGVAEAVCFPANQTRNVDLLTEIKLNKDFTFHFTAWINPEDPELDSFLDQHLNEIKFFKIHPSFQKRRITDFSYKKYIQIANDSHIPVIVHCGRWTEIANFRFPLIIAKEFPNLMLILAHLGGDQPTLMMECANELNNNNFKNVYLGTESVREFYFVEQVIKILGAKKIIFGSDYNLGIPQMYISLIDALKISAEEKDLIFYHNIKNIIESA